jgi:hypothetical protein
MRVEHFLHIIILLIAVGIALSGCKTRSPVVIDTGDIERLRSEYQQLRNDYDSLKSDYAQFLEDSQYYVDYYRNATAAIESGIEELNAIGNNQLTEIAKLRANIAVLRKIILGIIEGQQREGQQNSQTDGNEQ